MSTNWHGYRVAAWAGQALLTINSSNSCSESGKMAKCLGVSLILSSIPGVCGDGHSLANAV